MKLTHEQMLQALEVTEQTLKFALALPSPALALTGLLSAYASLALNSQETVRLECAQLLRNIAGKLEAHEDGNQAAPGQPMQHPMPSTVQ